MRQQSSEQAGSRVGDLDQVGLELEQWRRTHRPPTPIPDELWARAAALATRHGISAVARALALNQTQLKRRMEKSAAEVEERATFVELLPPPMPALVRECAIEVDCHRGNRVRVMMRDVPGQCLGGILRELVGG